MSDLLTEVDEAMRQERLKKFWDENSALIIFFVAGTIIMTGVFSGYNAWKDKAQKAQTTALIETLEAADSPTNTSDTKDLKALKAIAQLKAAASYIEDEKPEEALKLYESIANNKGAASHFRDLARLAQTRLSLSQETPDADALLETLAPILNGKSPFKPQAQIEAAAIHAHLKNDSAAAKALLDEVLETPDLPPSLYKKAQSLNHIYTLKGE
ncbi:MAG: hypothetical protein ACRBCT_07385 [Alphaproteobacteria bacterium]